VPKSIMLLALTLCVSLAWPEVAHVLPLLELRCERRLH